MRMITIKPLSLKIVPQSKSCLFTGNNKYGIDGIINFLILIPDVCQETMLLG